MNFELYLPARILFGAGKLEELSKQPLPGKKAIVVISGGKSVKANGALERLLKQLKRSSVETVVYDRIEANPVLETIDGGGALCRAEQCDFVVALGGGSVIDSAKMIAILGTNSGSIWDYVQTGSGGRKTIQNHPLPIVAIPTTAGTGSETDSGASFTRLQTNEKISVLDKRLLPAITVIDPELTYSLPAKFTAYQGWDALTHSMEYLLNTNDFPLCDELARKAVRLAGEALPEAVTTGSPTSREKMALASALSGAVIGRGGVTSQHALECAISAIYPQLPHGAGLILVSKAYFGFFIEKGVCDKIFVELARLLGKKDASVPPDFLDVIAQIHQQCGVDTLKMSDFGIDRARFPEMIGLAREAMGCDFEVDRYALSDQDCLDILERAYA